MENDFNQRAQAFNEEILKLQHKHGVTLYAANVVLKNGEVAPLVRLADATDQSFEMVKNENAYEDKPATGSGAGKKASKNRS